MHLLKGARAAREKDGETTARGSLSNLRRDLW